MPATDDWGRTTPNPLSAIGVALATALAFASAQPARPSNGPRFASTTFPERNIRSSTSAGRTDGTPRKASLLRSFRTRVPPSRCRRSEAARINSPLPTPPPAPAAGKPRSRSSTWRCYSVTRRRSSSRCPRKNIHALGDLCGKRVGVNIKTTSADQYNAMIRSARRPCAIEQVPIGTGGGGKEVLSGIVDAGVAFSYTDALQVKVISGGANIIPRATISTTTAWV
jgi:hypothetical protein